MNEKRIKQITKAVKRLAPVYGVDQNLEEDLVQEALLRSWVLDQNQQSQPMRFTVIDALRNWRGRGVTEETQSRRYVSKGKLIPYKEGMAVQDPLDPQSLDFRRCLDRLKVRERVVTVLYHLYGLDLKEIGHCFGVGESRASQYLRKAHTLMRSFVSSFGA